MTDWLAVVLAAVGTYLLRISFIVPSGRVTLPDVGARALRYVPAAVLAALAVPAVLAPDGRIELGPRLVAALVAVVVAWRTRSVAVTLLVGLPLLWLVRSLMG